MSSKIEEIKKEIENLIEECYKMILAHVEKQEPKKRKKEEATKNISSEKETEIPLIMRYNNWYSKALQVVKQVLPDRYQEFTDLYQLPKRDIKNITYLNYTISDYLLGLSISRGGEQVVHSTSAFLSKIQQQYSILNSALPKLKSILGDIKGVLQVELFDSELDAAKELVKNGHLRAAGTLCGVTLEKHLTQVITNHNLKLTKKDPTISDFNDKLKNENIIDIPNWRFVQRLGDLRNLCAHNKGREPIKDEVEELILGTEKIIKTWF